MASAAETPPRAELLAQLESLGDAAKFADRILSLIPKCRLLENFSSGEVRLLAHPAYFVQLIPSGDVARPISIFSPLFPL